MRLSSSRQWGTSGDFTRGGAVRRYWGGRVKFSYIQNIFHIYYLCTLGPARALHVLGGSRWTWARGSPERDWLCHSSGPTQERTISLWPVPDGLSQPVLAEQTQKSSTWNHDVARGLVALQPLQESLWICCILQRSHGSVSTVSGIWLFGWMIFSFVTFLCLTKLCLCQTFIPQHFWQVAKCKCAGACNCSISSTSPSRSRLRSANLSDALENCSLTLSSFLCDQCKKSFANSKNLARHVEKFHKRWIRFFGEIDFY